MQLQVISAIAEIGHDHMHVHDLLIVLIITLLQLCLVGESGCLKLKSLFASLVLTVD